MGTTAKPLIPVPEAGILYKKACALEERNEHFQAEQLFRMVLDIDPEFYPALFELGKLYSNEKKYSRAVGFFNQFLAIAQKYENPHASYLWAARVLRNSCRLGLCDTRDDLSLTTSKFYGSGKSTVYLTGHADHLSTARKCLESSLTVQVSINKKAFIDKMLKSGVPEKPAREIAEYAFVLDETYVRERNAYPW